MPLDSGDPLERMTLAEVIGLARALVGEVNRLRARGEELEGALAKLKVEHQAVKDELARLKKLPPRPPQKPSGMDKATDRPESEAKGSKGGRSTERRGSNLDKLTVTRTVVVEVEAPAGSRRKGYEDIVVQDVVLNPSVTRYRRERWETPDGETLVAPLDPGIIGGYGPHLHRLVLMLYFQGHMTCEKILALLKGMGVVISKRQVVRLLTAKLETFKAEDAAVLNAGLKSAPYVTVDDTGARHRGKAFVTTQIGSYNFAVFRTGESKSRQAFLERLCGGAAYYVVNEAALVSMRAHSLAQPLIDKLAGHPSRVFHCQADWMSHLSVLGLADLRVAPNPVRVASEAALWGAIREQGLLGETIVVSDGAGQFRVGEHAACWVHAERLVYKLIPANDIQRNAVVIARHMIWWFYRALKDYRLNPTPEKAERLRAQFDRIFNRMRTGYATLDKLLRRLFRLKDDLLRVLDRPEIPLHTNASESDIRVFVTKRKVSGGTVSDRGRDARDVMIGLAKTCAKLKIPFFDYLGARLGIKGPLIPNLAALLRPAPS
jgi:hypothetical protein